MTATNRLRVARCLILIGVREIWRDNKLKGQLSQASIECAIDRASAFRGRHRHVLPEHAHNHETPHQSLVLPGVHRFSVLLGQFEFDLPMDSNLTKV